MELIITNEDVQFVENSTEIINQMVLNNEYLWDGKSMMAIIYSKEVVDSLMNSLNKI
jgi:hypothetical protein